MSTATASPSAPSSAELFSEVCSQDFLRFSFEGRGYQVSEGASGWGAYYYYTQGRTDGHMQSSWHRIKDDLTMHAQQFKYS